MRAAVIYLVAVLLPKSSGLPKGLSRINRELKANNLVPLKRENLLLDLAPGGVCHAFNVTIEAVSFYLAFSPLPFALARGGIFSAALSVSYK